MSGWTAAAIAGGAIVGGYMSSNATQNAADTQAQSAQNATNAQLGMFNTMQNNLQPYMQTGAGALGRVSSVAGQLPSGYSSQFSYDPSKDPFYQFQLQQGTQNILNHQTALGGGLGGGNNLEALMQYGQGLAGQSYQQEFNNWLAQNSQSLGAQNQQFQQLYGLTGMGENAAAGVGQGAIQTGNSIAGNITGAANAQAASQIAQGNIWGSVAQQAFSPSNANAMKDYMNGPSSTGVGGSNYNYGGDYYLNSPSSGVILPQ